MSVIVVPEKNGVGVEIVVADVDGGDGVRRTRSLVVKSSFSLVE